MPWIKRISRKRLMLIGGGLVGVMCLLIVWSTLRDKHVAIPEPVASVSAVPKEAIPDETVPVAATYVWKGAAQEPRRIRIGVLGVDAFVNKVGVDASGAMAVPNNIHIAGWFERSAHPGEAGLSIIAGHVDGKSMPGVFVDLSKLKKGDVFEVERGDGVVLHYRVVSTQTVGTDAAANVLFSQLPSVASQLNLITCTGNFDDRNHQYLDRVIVMTALQ